MNNQSRQIAMRIEAKLDRALSRREEADKAIKQPIWRKIQRALLNLTMGKANGW